MALELKSHVSLKRTQTMTRQHRGKSRGNKKQWQKKQKTKIKTTHARAIKTDLKKTITANYICQDSNPSTP